MKVEDFFSFENNIYLIDRTRLNHKIFQKGTKEYKRMEAKVPENLTEYVNLDKLLKTIVTVGNAKQPIPSIPKPIPPQSDLDLEEEAQKEEISHFQEEKEGDKIAQKYNR